MKRKLTTKQRGYGWEHEKRRKAAARTVAAGLAVCWRCNRPIAPGEPFDLGHDDYDRSVYRGPEHQACNRATSGRRRRGSSRVW